MASYQNEVYFSGPSYKPEIAGESKDVEMIYIYQTYVRQKASKKTRGRNMNTKEMGYLSSVHDAKEILEKIFKNSTEQREL